MKTEKGLGSEWVFTQLYCHFSWLLGGHSAFSWGRYNIFVISADDARNSWPVRCSQGSQAPVASPATNKEKFLIKSPSQKSNIFGSWTIQARMILITYPLQWRKICSLQIINSQILRLHSADLECEICLWPTASEPVWYPRKLVGNLIEEELCGLT